MSLIVIIISKSEGKSPLDLAEDNQELKDVLAPPVIMNGHVENGQNGVTTEQSEDADSKLLLLSLLAFLK